MRGRVDRQGEIFHTFNLQELVSDRRPLRSIKARADRILARMSRRFAKAYSPTGRPSIPPERLIKGLLLQALYSIRSETQLCEQIGYNLLYRWFLDMNPSETVWTPEVFSMNRKRFQEHGFVRDFFDRVVQEALLDETYERHGIWPMTLGADGGYAEAPFLKTMELTGIRPHIPVPKRVIRGDGPSAEVRRRTRRRQSSVGYQLSQRARKRIEEIIGWCKTIGGLARTRFVDRWRTGLNAEMTAAAYNLLRMARLKPTA
jgi:transposase